MDETDIETGNGHEWDRVIERNSTERGLGGEISVLSVTSN